MKGFETYRLFKAYSLHFNDKVDYDCLKYNFKTKVNEDSFNRSKFKWQYVGFEKKYGNCDLRYLMFCIFARFDFGYVPEQSLNKIAKSIPLDPQTYLNVTFKKDLQHLKKLYNGNTSLFDSDGLYPNVYRELQSGNIELKTFLLLNCFILETLNIESRDIIAWPKFVQECNKIIPFIMYFFNQEEVKEAFTEYYLG